MTSYGWDEGAFQYRQEYDLGADVDSFQYRRAHALLGYKDMLKEVTNRKIQYTAIYGDATKNAVKDVQAAHGLHVDGVLGPTTAKVLCWCSANSFVRKIQAEMGVPNQYVGRIGDLESGYYLAARNELDEGNDRGPFQIHDSDNPERDYRDIAYQVQWASDRLIANHRRLQKSQPKHTWTQYWHAAIFAHNAPAWADDWLAANCASSGGPPITVGNWHGDMFAWADLYTNAVLKRQCL
jgi:hypothetical protein